MPTVLHLIFCRRTAILTARDGFAQVRVTVPVLTDCATLTDIDYKADVKYWQMLDDFSGCYLDYPVFKETKETKKRGRPLGSKDKVCSATPRSPVQPPSDQGGSGSTPAGTEPVARSRTSKGRNRRELTEDEIKAGVTLQTGKRLRRKERALERGKPLKERKAPMNVKWPAALKDQADRPGMVSLEEIGLTADRPGMVSLEEIGLKLKGLFSPTPSEAARAEVSRDGLNA